MEALQAAPHLLEHYILNEMFRDLDGKTPYEDYVQLVSRFALLRLMLAARCNTDGALPDAAALVGTVQVFCRRFQHDVRFAQRTNQALSNSGWITLNKVFSFLRS
jgi:lysine-N-methylase